LTGPRSTAGLPLASLKSCKEERESGLIYVLPARAMVGTILDRIPIGDIELIEIFRGPGELPPEFNEGNCGAISVWTRQAR